MPVLTPLPLLPTETWDAIICEATSIDNEFYSGLHCYRPSRGDRVSYVDVWPTPDYCNRSWKVALKTRTSLVGVCQQWYSLALPRLYSSLVLHEPNIIPLIVSAPTSPYFIQYCRRIHVTTTCPSVWRTLIENCKQLTLILMSPDAYLHAHPDGSVSVFRSPVSATLQVLVLEHCVGSFDKNPNLEGVKTLVMGSDAPCTSAQLLVC